MVVPAPSAQLTPESAMLPTLKIPAATVGKPVKSLVLEVIVQVPASVLKRPPDPMLIALLIVPVPVPRIIRELLPVMVRALDAPTVSTLVVPFV